MEAGQQYKMHLKVLIIGSGQLGSRHLQGVVRNPLVSEVWVIDEWENSLSLARDRSAEIDHNKMVHFSTTASDLPDELDFCIISGTANVRLKHLKMALESANIKRLLLEKILFSSPNDYEEAGQLRDRFPTMNVWVNHPRRMYGFYSAAKEVMRGFSERVFSVQVAGANWGLACNTLHFIDIWSYLRGATAISVDFSNSTNVVVPSKRAGFIEVFGSVSVLFSNGDHMNLKSDDADFTGMNFSFSDASGAFSISEMESLKLVDLSSNVVLTEGRFQYQSELTDVLISEIINRGSTELTTWEQAFDLHHLFVKSALGWYQRVKDINATYIPIT